ncbi:MAG TPA: ATP synthase F1 subunit delta [Armatimonadota bacterium]|nr:ATP synthase F1 subunit delta [Armatimonadota bacterium]
MRNDRASRRYAQALFSLAVDHGRIDEVSEDLDRAVRALDELPGVRSLFTQPLMPDRIKRDLVDKVFGDSISQLTRDFLHVVVARNRGDLFDQIRERYIELCNDYHGILPASVQSAVPLSESELAELSARLTRLCGKTVSPRCVVDPDLIGGVVVRMGDRVMDGSVRGALRRLRQRLKGTDLSSLRPQA